MLAAEAYAELLRRSKAIGVIQSCSAVLGWDQQTYMPRRGAELRGEQLAFLAGLAHQKITDPKWGELLAEVELPERNADATSPELANVREWRRRYDRATRVPAALVEELARVTTMAQQAWDDAKKTNSFPTFLPWLEKIVALKREEAQAVQADPQPGSPAPHLYDALLDEFEPGATASELTVLFAGLTAELVPLIQRIQDSPRRPNRGLLDRDFPLDRQRVFAESAAVAVGFDSAAGRLDVSSHPFCSGMGPGDCRITTRYNPRSFADAFFGVLHETGHALYEQNLPAEHFGTPLGSACSLGLHESQSRLWENQVGRGKPFWEHFFPRARQTFPAALGGVGLEEFLFAINDVRPSFIRVEADEATYNLHIALRFEIELDLLTGNLKAADVPSAWNERFRSYLGLDVPDDARGCLQDIHWSFGGIGYFPTYTLGNLYAAQFMEAARRDLGGPEGMAENFRRGDFMPLKEWLVKHVHRHGQHYRPGELCLRATGRNLSPGPFLAYLREKYGLLHGVC